MPGPGAGRAVRDLRPAERDLGPCPGGRDRSSVVPERNRATDGRDAAWTPPWTSRRPSRAGRCARTSWSGSTSGTSTRVRCGGPRPRRPGRHLALRLTTICRDLPGGRGRTSGARSRTPTRADLQEAGRPARRATSTCSPSACRPAVPSRGCSPGGADADLLVVGHRDLGDPAPLDPRQHVDRGGRPVAGDRRRGPRRLVVRGRSASPARPRRPAPRVRRRAATTRRPWTTRSTVRTRCRCPWSSCTPGRCRRSSPGRPSTWRPSGTA